MLIADLSFNAIQDDVNFGCFHFESFRSRDKHAGRVKNDEGLVTSVKGCFWLERVVFVWDGDLERKNHPIVSFTERNKPEMSWYLRIETTAENSFEDVDLFKCELSRSVVLVLNFAQIVRQSKLQVFDGASDVRFVATSGRFRLGVAKNFPRLPNTNCPINTTPC